jgi:hypothetical protein
VCKDWGPMCMSACWRCAAGGGAVVQLLHLGLQVAPRLVAGLLA